MTDPETLARIDRIEAQLAIQQLAVRYAMAIDARDIANMRRIRSP